MKPNADVRRSAQAKGIFAVRRGPFPYLMVVALVLAALGAPHAFADDADSSQASSEPGGATALLMRVEDRYNHIPLDFVTGKAYLAQAEASEADAERAASEDYEWGLRWREQQVAELLSRVAPEYREMEAQGPLPEPAYYEFESVYQVDDYTANDDGTLGWWQANWYTAHDWSENGEKIAAMRPGDVVVIDGYAITVEGKFIWPQESTYMEIMRRVGWDATVLQTCLGDNENIWIVYGR